MSETKALKDPKSNKATNPSGNSLIAKQTQDIQKLVQKILETPDCEQDKIKHFKKAVREGNYQANSQAIADAIRALKHLRKK